MHDAFEVDVRPCERAGGRQAHRQDRDLMTTEVDYRYWATESGVTAIGMTANSRTWAVE